MTRTIPEVREWSAVVLAASLYYNTCTFQGRDSAIFDALSPAERYPWIVQARAILEAQP
jgi:hypothetical protein